MVQVPTGAASAAAMRDSPASGSNNGSASNKGKHQAAGNTFVGPPAPLPYSALHSQPLDLTSVETRGQPTANREHAKRDRMFGLTEAPIYYPTSEEFKDPFEYMKKISPEASRYGICKIIPPEEWQPRFAIDTERFHFKTRKQELNSVEGSTRANLTYLDQLAKFHKQSGTSLTRFPSVDKRPLDLYKLKKAVEARGGFTKVCKLKKWAEIGRDLGYSGKIMSSLSTSLKNSYQRWLYPYEEYLRLAKPGVHQQLEYEYGGPLTPSPANSPAKKALQQTPSSLRDQSPAVRASDVLNSRLSDSADVKNVPVLDADTPTSSEAAPPVARPTIGGFTAVNSGGFTPVNSAPISFTPVNPSAKREREPEREYTPPLRLVDSPLSSVKHTPEYKPSALGATSITNGVTSNPALKRQMSHDSLASGTEGTPAPDDSGRRSKRLKRDVPTVAGSNMTMFRPSAPRLLGEQGAPGERCEQCGKSDNMDKLLVCESCDNGFHSFCVDQPFQSKPGHDWYCSRCLVGDGQFGFEEGGIYSLRTFQQKAAEFKENYFSTRLPRDETLNCSRPVTEDDIEREFWRLVASLEETVEVEYGADIHSTIHGSGFATVEKDPKDPYSVNPWNLNVMPLHGESLFKHIKSDISGMTVPWLYVGMIFSTFCWHNEDHYAYSANYQHFGSTKTWYGIPGADAEKFEAAMRNAVPELFETQPDLLFQLVTLLTPEQLQKAGISVYAVDQRAGQFVITFPQAYHAGFNHGFNLNEAVNFAPTDWEPFGSSGVERLQQYRKQPCFSHDELLWTAAEGHATGGVTIQTAKWLAPALERMQAQEMALRKAFVDKHKEKEHACVITEKIEGAGPRCHITMTIDDRNVAEEEYQCSYCKAYAFLSRFKCDKTGKILCLAHAGEHQCCDMSEEQRYAGDNHTLIYRYTEDQITAIHHKVVEKSQLPEQWEEKYNKMLEESATPSLKVMRSLLSEGERIPYELPSLSELKKYVDRCNDWVEEATNYIVRKQQNRRKSEKNWRKNSKSAEMEERERELRKVENVVKLLKDADLLGFDCPEITQLRERADAIQNFQLDAKTALANHHTHSVQEFEELVELGKGFNVDMPEIESIETLLAQMKWNDRAKELQNTFVSLKDVTDLIAEGEKLGIPSYNEKLVHFRNQRAQGESWEAKAKEVMSVEVVHYPQLEALSNQVQQLGIPVSAETLAAVDQILNKQREAHRQILSLVEKSKNPDPSQRPRYAEVRETIEQLHELNSKPSGTIDLEKELKRHEDWMRKGKKLFGKANAPLHILKSHMEYVLERNLDCFDFRHDRPREPVEPASRDHSPVDGPDGMPSWEKYKFREVFCICRKIEAGMMIECELCHEWYHGKCLKIARGKVKDEEKYTCPICDWRVKIPRDAARPKLEDLQQWQDEIANLPFIPDEEEILDRIVTNALEFKNHVAPYCNPIMPGTADEAVTQRFFLRKIEGAEILLSYETNFFRQELHKWQPVAPEPPPILDSSKSTRKPRPTKLQKLMLQHGVNNMEELPQSLRTKPHIFKRKSSEPANARPPALQPAPPGRADSQTPTHHAFPSGAPPLHHGPVLSGVASDAHMGFPQRYGYPPMTSAPPGTMPPAAFASHAYMGPFDSHSPHGRDPAIFTGAALARNDPALGSTSAGLESPMRDTFGSAVNGGIGPASSLNVDRMFNDLINHDDESKKVISDSRRGYNEETLERSREHDHVDGDGKAAEEESEFLKQVGYESAFAGESNMDDD